MQDHLSAFLPVNVLRYLSRNSQSSTIGLYPPFSHKFTGVALFADVSGFSSLTEKLASKGALGAEQLGLYLNQYLTLLGTGWCCIHPSASKNKKCHCFQSSTFKSLLQSTL